MAQRANHQHIAVIFSSKIGDFRRSDDERPERAQQSQSLDAPLPWSVMDFDMEEIEPEAKAPEWGNS